MNLPSLNPRKGKIDNILRKKRVAGGSLLQGNMTIRSADSPLVKQLKKKMQATKVAQDLKKKEMQTQRKITAFSPSSPIRSIKQLD